MEADPQMILIFELADKDFIISIINMLKKIEEKNTKYEKINNFNKELESIKKNQIDSLEPINGISKIKNSPNEIFPYWLVNTYWPKSPEFPTVWRFWGLPHDPTTEGFVHPARGLLLLYQCCK